MKLVCTLELKLEMTLWMALPSSPVILSLHARVKEQGCFLHLKWASLEGWLTFPLEIG